MTIHEISESELHEAGISSLSNHPTSPYAFGGEGLTPTRLKERFDRLPRLVAERLNLILRALATAPDHRDPAGDSIAELIQSGLGGGHSLADFFGELTDGTAAGYFTVGDESLAEALAGKEPASRIKSAPGSGVLTLKSGFEYRFGELGDLTVTLPDEPSEDFAATLVFDSKAKNGESHLTVRGTVKWSGDDVVGGNVVVFGGKHYTCMLWYDGEYQGIVRSVPR